MSDDLGVVPRWGIPDAFLCWLGGFAGAALAGIVGGAVGLALNGNAFLFGVAVPLQYAAITFVAVVVCRTKGSGSLVHDFGWRVRDRDWPAAAAGCALQVALFVVLAPIVQLAHLHGREPQQLVEQAAAARSTVIIALILIGTAVVAPVVEELVFRGVLLRALLRRTSDGWAIVVSALLFAAAHLVDPGARYVFPGLFLLGLVLGVLAVRDRSLSRPILVHGGFNLLAALLTVHR